MFPGFACINPPIPPNDTHSLYQYVGNTSVPFGEGVTYICEEGYFFEENMTMTSYNLTCNDDGSWSSPEPWKICIHPGGKISCHEVENSPLYAVAVSNMNKQTN